MQTTAERDEACDYYRNHVIPPEKLNIIDRATEELTANGIKPSALKEGDRVDDFILMALDEPMMALPSVEHIRQMARSRRQMRSLSEST